MSGSPKERGEGASIEIASSELPGLLVAWRRAKSEPLLAAARSMVAVAADAASEDRARRMVAGTVLEGTASLRVRTGVGKAVLVSDISEEWVRSNSNGT